MLWQARRGLILPRSAYDPAPGGGGGGPLVFTYTASAANGATPAPPVTFSSVNIGTASSDRIVCVAVAALGSASPNMDITSVTIGGNAAAQSVYSRPSSGPRIHSLWHLLVTSGTTANIVVSGFTNGWVDRIVINVGHLTGSATASVASTTTGAAYANGSVGQAVTVPANGMCVLSSYADSNGTPNTSLSWTNATGNYSNDSVGFGATGAIASRSTSATITQAVANSGGTDGWVSAQFQP